MKGFILVLLAILTITFAQEEAGGAQDQALDDEEGGCCLYRGTNYTDVLYCGNDPAIEFNKPETIGSFFCTDAYSASIYKNAQQENDDDPEERVQCGDEADVLIRPITGVKSFAISGCARSVCCFYSARDFSGYEFCVVDQALSVPEPEFKDIQGSDLFGSGYCQPGFSAVLEHPSKPQLTVPCGGELVLDTGVGPRVQFKTVRAEECDAGVVSAGAQGEEEEIGDLDAEAEAAIVGAEEGEDDDGSVGDAAVGDVDSDEGDEAVATDVEESDESGSNAESELAENPIFVRPDDVANSDSINPAEVASAQSGAHAFAAALLVVVSSCLVHLMA